MDNGDAYERVPLPGNEDYLLQVAKITLINKPDFNGNNKDFLRVEFDIVSFADGEPLEDIEGNKVHDRKTWKDLDITRLGFRKDGTASVSRQFLVYVNGLTDINAAIPDGDTADLVGKQLVASMIVKTGERSGKQFNNIISFKPINRRRRGTSEATKSDQYAKTVASLISGDDDPSDEDVSNVKAALA